MDLNFLRNVRFVSPGNASESLKALHIQYGSRDVNQRLQFICFSGAALHSNEELVWTVQSLLPQWIPQHSTTFFSYPDIVCDRVQLRTVAEHVNKLCSSIQKDSLISNPDTVKTLAKVLQKAFAFFTEKDYLDEQVKNILSRTCCIFVTDSFDLVSPNQVAIDIRTEDEIRPFLFKIPLELCSYVSVLTQLGTTRALTVEQYAYTLKRIADGSQGNMMHPEEKKASCRASEGLLKLIEKGETVNSDVFLPCTDNKLRMSSKVVFNDKNMLLKRLFNSNFPILVDSKDLNIKSDLENILKKMPVLKQPRFLSQIVEEVLVDGEPTKCEFAEKLAAKLRSSVFRSGLERIVRHCFAKNKSRHANWNDETLKQKCKQLMDILDSIEFIGRVQVQTYLKCDGSKLDGSEKIMKYFREKSQDGEIVKCRFYLSADAWPSNEAQRSLYRDICRVLNRNVGMRNIDIDENLLFLILDCPLNEIHEQLDSNEVMESESSRSFVPPLGCYVPEEFLDLLIHDNFIFYPGQLVALEIDDPFDKGEFGEPVFLLVEIVQRLVPADPKITPLLSKYKIRVGCVEERTVDATSLYAFSRYNMESSYDQILAVHDKLDEATCNRIPKPPPNEPAKVKSLKEIVEDIKKILKDAWKGTPEERNRVRKRLYLTWHPDKNPDKIDLCTEVCKILQHLITLLEKGRSIDDYMSDKSSSSSGYASGDGSGFDDFYKWAGHRANYFNRRRNRSHSRSSGRYSGGFYSSRQEHENFFTGFRNNRNPQPGEAGRWMRQARHNIDAFRNDHNAFDWRCLKCHEAAKIALMAVQYAMDSNAVPSDLDRIDSVLRSIGDAELSRLSRELEHVVSGAPRMKYPRGHVYPRIPGEVYNESQASEAYRLSERILDRCARLIEDQD